MYVDGNSLQRYLVAIVVPDEHALRKWYRDNVTSNGVSFEEMCQSKDVYNYLLSEMQKIGKENKLNSIEQVRPGFCYLLESVQSKRKFCR